MPAVFCLKSRKTSASFHSSRTYVAAPAFTARGYKDTNIASCLYLYLGDLLKGFGLRMSAKACLGNEGEACNLQQL